MHIKKGDTVVVISGADRGKNGKVVRAIPKDGRIVVEGINKRKKHERARRSNQKGQVVERALPIHVSNVALIDPSDGKATRVGKQLSGDRYVRISRRSGNTI